MEASSRIWLVTNDGARRQRWRVALNVPECQVLDLANVANQRVDVIVSDRPLTAAELAALPTSASRGQSGLVAVGWRGAADVHLGDDSTDRELRLACGLLGRVVQQRRALARQAREQELLRHMALSDPLTGLANRRVWDEEFPRRLADADGTGRTLGLAILDLDQLKDVNERCGYGVGDQQLRAVARGLSAATSPSDLVVRLGGDEFALILAECDPRQVSASMSRLREQLDETLDQGQREWRRARDKSGSGSDTGPCSTISIGWVVIPPHAGSSPEEWLVRADRALRTAKRRGRAQSVGFSADLDAEPGLPERSPKASGPA
jgi:diguanylate cyclase (GGDEF)-like protein